jgi:O-methyltransferase
MSERSQRRNRYRRTFERFRDSTMIGREAYVANLELVQVALEKPGLEGGSVVECGTWRGGMSAGLMTVGGIQRNYYFFDSFAGLPPAGPMDGMEAQQWQLDKAGSRYFNNCTASMEEFLEVISRLKIPSAHINVFPGFFTDTFPRVTPSKIAVLRLDVDWYESTLICLNMFWDALLPGALVLVDDYYDWEGCRRAVHEFFTRRVASEAIQQSSPGSVCYFIKK